MTFWLSFAASYVVTLAVALAFNHAAHRKPSPRREPDPTAGPRAHPARGNILQQAQTTTGTSGVLVAEDTAETGWT